MGDADHRAHINSLVHRGAGGQAGRVIRQPAGERIVHAIVDEHALDTQQFCPACAKAPDAMASTAESRSASGMTITGEFEPSSIDSFLRPAVREMCSPVLTPPST